MRAVGCESPDDRRADAARAAGDDDDAIPVRYFSSLSVS
jgi:hypothetical protein